MNYKYTVLWNATIINMLAEHGIKCRIMGFSGLLAINRTDCHNAKICKNLKDWEIADFILELIREAVEKADGKYNSFVVWSGKTDDEWFLDVMEKNYWV